MRELIPALREETQEQPWRVALDIDFSKVNLTKVQIKIYFKVTCELNFMELRLEDLNRRKEQLPEEALLDSLAPIPLRRLFTRSELSLRADLVELFGLPDPTDEDEIDLEL